jgi:hypothetical protein
VSKRTASPGLGSLGSGALTAAALAVQTGLAAVVGVVIAREFGRTAETDGFFAAYGIFIVVVLAATAIRIAVLPSLARARAGRRLGAEVGAYALTLATLAVPLVVLGLTAARPLAWLLTGNGASAARDTAATALPWMLGASVLQLYAGLAASSLAALDDYLVAALGYAVGSVAGLVYILVRVHADGIDAVSHGMALNGLIAVGVPTAALALRARREAMPVAAVRPLDMSFSSRIAELGVGVSLPLALQAIYVVCLPFAGREGTGSVTSFGYAYLIGSALVAVTAGSLGLVTSVPITRAGLDAHGVARHVDSSSWLALVGVTACTGVFAAAGGPVVHGVLGAGYGARVGDELGRLVVALAPWMVASIGVSVAFPLVFVQRCEARLPAYAAGLVALHVPLAAAGQVVAGLYGLAAALAATTTLGLAAVLADLGTARVTLAGLASAAARIGAIGLVAFVPTTVFLPPAPAAVLGVLVFVALVAALRPLGLRQSWGYLRSLG